MSLVRHITKTFALLACLVLLSSSLGCSGDSVVAPAFEPAGAAAESPKDIMSTPKGELEIQAAKFGNVGG
jgi:hypothetical protein